MPHLRMLTATGTDCEKREDQDRRGPVRDAPAGRGRGRIQQRGRVRSAHAIESELKRLKVEQAEQQVADQLRGLGYVE